MKTEPVQADNRDDQELANALAGLSTNDVAQADAAEGLAFEETPAPNGGGAVSDSPFGAPVPPAPDPDAPTTSESVPVTVSTSTPVATPAPLGDPTLDGIKKDALNELRPLVDKLDVTPEEKFDTYLLLLRSTDDTALIGPAHDAAKAITDEARRAQALLDVIKEIDYLTNQNK